MRRISVIGIGTGNPDHLTLEAIRAIGEADVLFVPTKGEDKAELADVRRAMIERHGRRGVQLVEFAVPKRQVADLSYREGVDRWHAEIAELHERLFLEHLPVDAPGGALRGATGAFLVWGDPMLYDSTIRILERMLAGGRVTFTFAVLPGVTSIQLLAARHRIPINAVGQPVTIAPARRLAEVFPDQATSVVVMLDGEEAFARIEDPAVEIFWGAYLGLPQEITIAGPLLAVREAILATRRAARARHGWIMDIYLLRKPTSSDE